MSRPWLTRNVLVLGLVSLLNDAASEMVLPLLPIFLTGTLGATAAALGWIEGAADTTAALLKLYSGRLSDRWGRSRPLVVGGYAFSNLVRPLIALASGAATVMAVRVADRVGKGVRTSPRDALLAVAAPEARRGTVYAFHRAMDHAGAVLGGLAAWAVLSFVTEDLRTLFWLSAVPGVLVVALVVAGLREDARPPPSRPPSLGAVPPRLRWVLVAVGTFGLGNASDAFLLLKAGASGVGLAGLPLLWVLLHVVKSVASLGAGPVADRIGRRRVIAAGWAVYASIYAAFAFVESPAWIAVLFVAYGMYHGLSEGAERALVAELAEAEGRGTAFGWYHLVSGLVALPASVLFGWLWTAVSPGTAFLVGAGFACLAVLPLAVSVRAPR